MNQGYNPIVENSFDSQRNFDQNQPSGRGNSFRFQNNQNAPNDFNQNPNNFNNSSLPMNKSMRGNNQNFAPQNGPNNNFSNENFQGTGIADPNSGANLMQSTHNNNMLRSTNNQNNNFNNNSMPNQNNFNNDPNWNNNFNNNNSNNPTPLGNSIRGGNSNIPNNLNSNNNNDFNATNFDHNNNNNNQQFNNNNNNWNGNQIATAVNNNNNNGNNNNFNNNNNGFNNGIPVNNFNNNMNNQGFGYNNNNNNLGQPIAGGYNGFGNNYNNKSNVPQEPQKPIFAPKLLTKVQIISLLSHVVLIFLSFAALIQTGMFIDSYQKYSSSFGNESDEVKQFNSCRDGVLAMSIFLVICFSASLIICVLRSTPASLKQGILGAGGLFYLIFFILGVLFLAIQPKVNDSFDVMVEQMNKMISIDEFACEQTDQTQQFCNLASNYLKTQNILIIFLSGGSITFILNLVMSMRFSDGVEDEQRYAEQMKARPPPPVVLPPPVRRPIIQQFEAPPVPQPQPPPPPVYIPPPPVQVEKAPPPKPEPFSMILKPLNKQDNIAPNMANTSTNLNFMTASKSSHNNGFNQNNVNNNHNNLNNGFNNNSNNFNINNNPSTTSILLKSGVAGGQNPNNNGNFGNGNPNPRGSVMVDNPYNPNLRQSVNQNGEFNAKPAYVNRTNNNNF